MKEIILHGKCGKGKVALVDNDVYEYLNQWRWNLGRGRYARRSVVEKGKHRIILMHRVIMNVADPKVFIDHKDMDGLNNQRDNLRVATRSQNMANRKRLTRNNKRTSNYKGVHQREARGKIYWIANCMKDGKVYKKWCHSEIEAAVAYNELATILHGEYAVLNNVPEELVKEYEVIRAIEIERAKYKECTSCNNIFPVNEFLQKSKDGPRSVGKCRKCYREKTREYNRKCYRNKKCHEITK